jgi:exosortase
LLGLAWAVLAVGILINSPWLAAIAALLLLAAIAFGLGGKTLALRLLPAWILLWLAVPLPDQLDARLVQSLQRITAVCASHVLDVFGVYHFRDGNLIEVGGRRLEVEATCSGVQSLFSILACSLFWLFWKRRPLLHGVALLSISLLWVLVGNVTRILAVACFDGVGGVNLGEGVGHEILGFCLFGLTLVLVWSTDQLLLPLTVLVAIRWRRPPAEDEYPASNEPRRAAAPTRLPPFGATALAAWPVVAAFGVLALTQLSSLRWAGGDGWVDLPADVALRIESLGEDTLPKRWGSWQRSGFEVIRRKQGDALGQTSRMWHFQRDNGMADASLDYPFLGWHKLTECYTGQGWTIEDQEVHQAEAGKETGPFVTVRMHKPLEVDHAYLVFQIRYASGEVRCSGSWCRMCPLAPPRNKRLRSPSSSFCVPSPDPSPWPRSSNREAHSLALRGR